MGKGGAQCGKMVKGRSKERSEDAANRMRWLQEQAANRMRARDALKAHRDKAATEAALTRKHNLKIMAEMRILMRGACAFSLLLSSLLRFIASFTFTLSHVLILILILPWPVILPPATTPPCACPHAQRAPGEKLQHLKKELEALAALHEQTLKRKDMILDKLVESLDFAYDQHSVSFEDDKMMCKKGAQHQLSSSHHHQ